MKYIKYFEDQYIRRFWLIRTDSPYLEISIDKLNLPQKQKDFLLNNEYITGKKRFYHSWDNKYYTIRKVYIADSNYRPEDYNIWELGKDKLIHFYAHHVYMGEVEVTEEELKAYKYNL